jgi:hypothetical protein
LRDRAHHAFDLIEYLIIPEPKHEVPTRVQECGSARVSGNLLIDRMPPTIHFDHQPMMVAGKIRMVLTDCRLSAEVRIWIRQTFEMPPELPLCIGHRPPQLACAGDTGIGRTILLVRHRTPRRILGMLLTISTMPVRV